MKLKIINHPLLKTKISIIQNKETNSRDFREAIKAITYLMGFEAFKHMSTQQISITTPLAQTHGEKLAEKIVFCPILRAGLSMVEPFLDLIPEANVMHIGVKRIEEENNSTHAVYYKPHNAQGLTGSTVYVLDPMIATGLSVNLTLSYLKSINVAKIIVIGIMGAPEGLDFIMEKHPDVDIYLASLGDRLTKNNFITPGLGDAGDRFFGVN